MIDIDGSFGEGGGQILRTSLALSIVTGQAFLIRNIRAARRKPGLRRQHLAAVNAAAEIAKAKVEGASLGSRELTFKPESIAAGEYQFAVGTSGSATLVLQTILPALIVEEKSSTLILEGGTHNPHAPPFDFLQNTFLPILNRMGPTITATLERRGFYPAGNGRFTVLIKPASHLSPIQLLERGKIQRCRATAIVAGLPEHVAQRELNVVRERLGWPDESLHLEALPDGPGNVLMLEVQCERITETFTGFGERGVPAERVAERAVTAAKTYLDANVPVGKLLADQLILPFAIAASRSTREIFRSSFKTLPLSSHAMTNIEVVKKFLDVDVRVKPESDRVCIVEIVKAR
ncbi:MAG: RNA 3'-terminal phosphate cyclase [Limisphaerales bacterium]